MQNLSNQEKMNIHMSIAAKMFTSKFPNCEVPEEYISHPATVDERPSFILQTVQDVNIVPKGTEVLCVDMFCNEITWGTLTNIIEEARPTIKVLYLGYNGCVFGTRKETIEVCSMLPNLECVYYCGYHYDNEHIYIPNSISAVPIY